MIGMGGVSNMVPVEEYLHTHQMAQQEILIYLRERGARSGTSS